MSQLTIAQVGQAAYDAGFRGEALVTIVAIAHGESALIPNAVGDKSLVDGKWGPSVGLFQIRSLNDQKGTGAARDINQLADPRFNARAAWEISSGGTNFKPWSVYKHDLHLKFVGETRAVISNLEMSGAFAAGEVAVPGSDLLDWDSGARGNNASDPQAFLDALNQPGAQGSGSTIEQQRLQQFLDAALAQQGDRYDNTINVSMDDPDPDAFDCSELVKWAAAQADVEFADGSWLQYQSVANSGTDMSVEEALRTPGALLFRFGSDPWAGGRPIGAHVAISLGDGRTMEAMGTNYGVKIAGNAAGRNWTHAGVIPGIGTVLPTEETVSLEEIPYDQDSDSDGIRDRLEIYIGTDPFSADTDRDGFGDIDELLRFDTDPLDYASSPFGTERNDGGWRPALTNADGPPPPSSPRLTVPPYTPPPAPTPPPAAPPPVEPPPVEPPPVKPPPGEPPPIDTPPIDPPPIDTPPVDTPPVDPPPIDTPPVEPPPVDLDTTVEVGETPMPSSTELLQQRIEDAFGIESLAPDDVAHFEGVDATTYTEFSSRFPSLPTTFGEFESIFGDLLD